MIQLIVGITNPPIPIVFTVTGYEYQIVSGSNYGVSFVGTTVYSPVVVSGSVLGRGQLNM
jgi:hypothetical protein